MTFEEALDYAKARGFRVWHLTHRHNGRWFVNLYREPGTPSHPKDKDQLGLAKGWEAATAGDAIQRAVDEAVFYTSTDMRPPQIDPYGTGNNKDENSVSVAYPPLAGLPVRIETVRRLDAALGRLRGCLR